MLEGRTYVPLLHARLAEMRALRELSTSTKNLLFPIIRVRPWLNSKSLSKVFDVITDALGARSFGLDLDTFKFLPDSVKAVDREFAALFDSSDGYYRYYQCVAERPNRIPVIRRVAGVTHSINVQVQHAAALDRGLVVRVNPEDSGDFLAVANACCQASIENVVFIFDCGWALDILQRAASCVATIDSLLNISEFFEIVVAGSSFPASFAGRGVRFTLNVNERNLFQEVRRNINRGQITYGDWGSTRPPTNPIPMTNIPRIDFADRSDWTCWRSEGGENYQDVANRVTADPIWTGDTDLWGDYMIASTAAGLDPAIRSPAMAAAVRVNLHLHAQAHFDLPDIGGLQDEPVGEDL